MNWTNIIQELSGAGVTQREIAEHCGCRQSTISEIFRGDIKNPSYPIGKSMIELHAAKVGAGETTSTQKAA